MALSLYDNLYANKAKALAEAARLEKDAILLEEAVRSHILQGLIARSSPDKTTKQIDLLSTYEARLETLSYLAAIARDKATKAQNKANEAITLTEDNRTEFLNALITNIRAGHIARLGATRAFAMHEILHGADNEPLYASTEPEVPEAEVEHWHPNVEGSMFFASLMYLPLFFLGFGVKHKNDFEWYKKRFEIADAGVWSVINILRYSGPVAGVGLSVSASLGLLLGGYAFDFLNQMIYDYKNMQEQKKYLYNVNNKISTLKELQTNENFDEILAFHIYQKKLSKSEDNRMASDDAKRVEKDLREKIIALLNELTLEKNQDQQAALKNQIKHLLKLEEENYTKTTERLITKIYEFNTRTLFLNAFYGVGLSAGAICEILWHTGEVGAEVLGFSLIVGFTAANQIKNLIFTWVDYAKISNQCDKKLDYLHRLQFEYDSAKDNVETLKAINIKLAKLGMTPIDFNSNTFSISNYINEQQALIKTDRNNAWKKAVLHTLWYGFVLSVMAVLVFTPLPAIALGVFVISLMLYGIAKRALGAEFSWESTSKSTSATTSTITPSATAAATKPSKETTPIPAAPVTMGHGRTI